MAAYEESQFKNEKRVSLARLVLSGEDEESMRAFAQAFENPRSGFMQHIYWEDLDDETSTDKGGMHGEEEDGVPSCANM